jgi:hypothetical protein
MIKNQELWTPIEIILIRSLVFINFGLSISLSPKFHTAYFGEIEGTRGLLGGGLLCLYGLYGLFLYFKNCSKYVFFKLPLYFFLGVVFLIIAPSILYVYLNWFSAVIANLLGLVISLTIAHFYHQYIMKLCSKLSNAKKNS